MTTVHNTIYDETIILQKDVHLGIAPRDEKLQNISLKIGKHALLRTGTIIYRATTIGDYFQTGHHALIREQNTIGDHVSVGTNAVLESGNKIGNNVRIHSLCFLENTTIGNNVFIGPHVVFTDDPHPACPRYKECVLGAIVEDHVSIGANSTILPGIRIGKNSLIGAGSVVTKDVAPNSVVAGVPARKIKEINELECFKGFYKKPYEWREKTGDTHV
ncbi:MAG: acyltransferase [Nanoarchaeota archaeon]